MNARTERTAARRSRREPAGRLQVTFWGARGSTPVSGSAHIGFGGDTICLEIEAGARRVIVDAGSGMLALGEDLTRRGVTAIDIILTHLHLDHLLGLMNFAPLFAKGTRVTVHAPVLDEEDPQGALSRLFCEPYWPVTPEETDADFTVRTFRPGQSLSIDGWPIETCALSHPGGACGYRIAHGGRSLVVAFDHEHGDPERDRQLVAFAREADLVLYDAAWDEREDYDSHRGWGHSTWQAGLALIRDAGAGRLVCLHHAPTTDDQVLGARERALQALAPGSLFARQNQRLVAGPDHPVRS